ncbi:DoxX family protein, partial [Fulvivirga sp. RKSG066]|uniref:DoxX family protein n=1 Tax=Fulvivirga aurantia TaxID=2529383 RepID=UPI0012BC643A
DYLQIALKLIVGLSILNVWLLNFGKSTRWRGKDANNMKEEFAAYGLSETFMKVIGTLKVLLAIALIASIWYLPVEIYAAGGIAVLMLGAVAMHIKVSDPIMKSLPAATFLILSVVIILI